MLTLVLCGLALCLLMMFTVWLIQIYTRDASIVDVFWPMSIAATVCLFATFGSGAAFNRWLVVGLVLAWGLRLAVYSGVRAYLEPEEDHRFASLREQWGEAQNQRFLPFFLAQGFCAWLLSLAFLPLAFHEQTIRFLWVEVGVALAILAMVLQTVADAQLLMFRQNASNNGKTLRTGLWRLCRHPNYFLEWIYWLAIAGLGLASCFVWQSQGGWVGEYRWVGGFGLLSLLAPVFMFFVLTKVTGIPMTEAHCVQSRKDYALYQRQVPSFFPHFKSEVSSSKNIERKDDRQERMSDQGIST